MFVVKDDSAEELFNDANLDDFREICHNGRDDWHCLDWGVANPTHSASML
jgi:hypothetical protein